MRPTFAAVVVPVLISTEVVLLAYRFLFVNAGSLFGGYCILSAVAEPFLLPEAVVHSWRRFYRFNFVIFLSQHLTLFQNCRSTYSSSRQSPYPSASFLHP